MSPANGARVPSRRIAVKANLAGVDVVRRRIRLQPHDGRMDVVNLGWEGIIVPPISMFITSIDRQVSKLFGSRRHVVL